MENNYDTEYYLPNDVARCQVKATECSLSLVCERYLQNTTGRVHGKFEGGDTCSGYIGKNGETSPVYGKK